MNWKELDSIRAVAITLYKHGKSFAECAQICGCEEEDIRKLYKKYGVGRNENAKELKPRAVELLKQGFTAEEIADQLEMSDSWVRNIAYENDISPMTEVQREREQLIKFVQQYKAKGMSAPEISEQFGINISFVRKHCVGISPQSVKPISERLQKPIEQIEALGFEYVGGFVNTDSYVTLRCPKCGATFQRSMISIRKKDATRCPECYQREVVEYRRQVKEKRKAQLEAERKAAKEERERRKQEEAEIKLQRRIHECPVCGQITTNIKYCSKECAKRAMNAQHDLRRRLKIKDALVDKDISLPKLYKRDHGICYLCGKKCDWNDKEERDGTIICGNNYPSIEHVIPLARGGEHSWENVKLACRGCNTKKHTSLLTTISSPITSK